MPQNDIHYERKFWKVYLINKIFIIPILCSLCENKHVYLNDNESINNLYLARCSNPKCRKIYYLRGNSILGKFSRTKASTLLYIIKLWIIEKKWRTNL